MQSIKHLVQNPTTYRGSENTRDLVRAEIERRYGSDEAAKYDPLVNCRTYSGWLEVNRRVKPKEKAIRSYTVVEKKDNSGEVVESYRRSCCLFYVLQTEEA